MRFELLRDLLLAADERSWLCLRASGTGGGVFFWGVGVSERLRVSSVALFSDGMDSCSDVSWEAIWDVTVGVGGSGLFRSELDRVLGAGEDIGCVAEKSEKDTVCGALLVTSLP